MNVPSTKRGCSPKYSANVIGGMDGRRIYWPRGRVLGGSSSINGLIVIRGQPDDYDHWARLGNTGWSWNEVLPYFIKAESNPDPAESQLHGRHVAAGALERRDCLLIDRIQNDQRIL